MSNDKAKLRITRNVIHSSSQIQPVSRMDGSYWKIDDLPAHQAKASWTRRVVFNLFFFCFCSFLSSRMIIMWLMFSNILLAVSNCSVVLIFDFASSLVIGGFNTPFLFFFFVELCISRDHLRETSFEQTCNYLGPHTCTYRSLI